MSVKRIYKKFNILAVTGVWLLTGCHSADESIPSGTNTPVAVNLSRAEGVGETGTGEGSYGLVFWYAKEGSTGPLNDLDFTGSPTSWFNTINTVADVNSHRFEGGTPLPVVNGLTAVMYPENNSSIYAVGFYPVENVSGGHDFKTLTVDDHITPIDLLTPNVGAVLPGLVDVCTTEIETGSESAPFTSSQENELQFRHTQVKLNFKYKRTENLNGRIAEIWVSIPAAHIANEWTLTEGGYEVTGRGTSNTVDTKDNPLIFASNADYYVVEENIEHSLGYAAVTVTEDKTTYTISEGQTDCYVMPTGGGSEVLFSGEDGSQQYITFDLHAVVISSAFGTSNVRYDRKVTIPLKDENGNPWTKKVQTGDAFTITIVFDSNRMELYAEKGKWDKGSWIVIPLDPSVTN